MTLREKINDTLLQLGMGDMSTYEAEDTILAAIREHMTSPEAVERGAAAYANSTGYYVPFHRGLSSESSDAIRRGTRAAILVALGEE